MYAAMLFAIIKDFSWKQTVVFLLAVAITIALTDKICAAVIRPYVERYRPCNAESPIYSLAQVVEGHRPGGRYGFPSCHAANTFALATIISLFIKRNVVTVFLFSWAIVTCYTRIYLAAHYPGDLVVGAIVGSVVGWLTYLAAATTAHRWSHEKYRGAETGSACIDIPGSNLSFRPSSAIIAIGAITVVTIIIIALLNE